MPTKNTQRAIRLNELTLIEARYLGKKWGPVKELSFADVVAECVLRVYEQETKPKKKRKC